MSDAPIAGSVRDALEGAVDALAAAGVETPRLDAEVLLAEATGWERARLAADPEAGVPAAAARRFGEMVRRRLRREPVAYILGHKGFRSIELAVDPRVLIPRPETELLVELALELRPRRVLDVGTGSGAIALAIAAEMPECEVVATDTSAAALEVARSNAERLNLADQVEFFERMLPVDVAAMPALATTTAIGSGAGPAERLAFDLVVANVPYVADPEWGGLEPEVTQWEPREALLAGPDGLDVMKAVIPLVATVAPSLALEVGAGQAEVVGEMLFEAGFTQVEARPDLAGIPRVVWGKR
jgi:release factor glutamine methyltransferase